MLNALITSIVVSASVASAAPCEQPVAAPVVQYQHHKAWETLTGPLKLDARRTTTINVGKQAGGFMALELKALHGSTDVKQVKIEFGNGTSQVVRLDQCLDANNHTVKIDHDGNARFITQIKLTGSSNWNGSYEVLAV